MFSLNLLFAGRCLGASELKIVKNGTAALSCFLNLANLKSSLSSHTGREVCNNPFMLCQPKLFKEEGAGVFCHAYSHWYVLMGCFLLRYHEVNRRNCFSLDMYTTIKILNWRHWCSKHQYHQLPLKLVET